MWLNAGINKIRTQSLVPARNYIESSTGMKFSFDTDEELRDYIVYVPFSGLFLTSFSIIDVFVVEHLAGIVSLEDLDDVKVVEELTGQVHQANATRAGQVNVLLDPESILGLTVPDGSFIVIGAGVGTTVKYGNVEISGGTEYHLPMTSCYNITVETGDKASQVSIARFKAHAECNSDCAGATKKLEVPPTKS